MSTTPSLYQSVGISPDRSQLPCRQPSPSASLCEDCARVDDWDAKIAAAEISLLEMKQARQKALTEANYRHDVLMSRFPLEICSEIFRQCLPSVELTHQQNSMPLVLSAVSRRWRALSHSMPDLWATMGLRVSTRNDYRSNIQAEVAQDWIGRSRQLPLTVVIDISLSVDPQGVYFPAVIAAVNQQSCRLAYLWMRVPGNLLDRVNFEKHGAQKLLQLTVHSLGAIKHGPRFVSCAPICLNVSINNPWNLFKRYGILTDNLTEAHLIGIQWQDLMEIFQNSRRLRSCSIHGSLRGASPWEPWIGPNQIKPPTIVHDTLQSLHLSEQRSIFIFTILMELLTLPSLTELRFSSEGGHNEVNIRDFSDQLQAHIDRSASKLAVLALCNFNFPNFDEEPLYTPISALVRAVGPTIRRVIIEPSANTRFQEPARLIRSIVDCGVPLPLLESLQVYGPPKWWMHMLRRLTIVGEEFYTETGLGRTIQLTLNARKCSGWWANTLNELIGLQRTHSEDYDEDDEYAGAHDDFPPLSIEDIDKLVSSITAHPPRFLLRVFTTKEGISMDVCPQVIENLLGISNE
ncbi:hypothetical protein D9619_003735 [Psilocybe cf. subviscida]|uniref:F-box domain-containing protein n=1 Tax=Psilocybe cf. subviscida TaxID=2480587 RepID=A0A8H5EUH0_9AGAR|nr:hypothetical protein D9619_003735 [Psilocybe cf. subviscida]